MIQIKVSSKQLSNYLNGITHKTFQQGLINHWVVYKNNCVNAQSVFWLFCWAKTGMNSQSSMKQVQNIFDNIFKDINFRDFDKLVPHKEARKLRYRKGNIEHEIEKYLSPD